MAGTIVDVAAGKFILDPTLTTRVLNLVRGGSTPATEQNKLAVLSVQERRVIALVAENTGHVKAVAEMTGEDLDPYMGRAIGADGDRTGYDGLYDPEAATGQRPRDGGGGADGVGQFLRAAGGRPALRDLHSRRPVVRG